MNCSIGQVCDEMHNMLERMKLGYLRTAEQYNLTKVQVFAIYAIAKHGELPMGKVAEVLHCDASNVTGIVDRLVTQGLIMRTESSTDRRSKVLSLTDKAKTIVQEIQKSGPGCIGLNRLTPGERNQLHELLLKMQAVDEPTATA